MDVIEAIKTRKSIRGFKSTPVPRQVLEEILSIATCAPSALNTQPWEITVFGGEVLENIKKGQLEKLAAGEPPEDFPRFEGEYRERQVALAIQIFKLMDIAREDKEKRAKWMEHGFRYFDAPVGIILSLDSSLGVISRFDLGSIAQTICLVAASYGLGTCIHDQGVSYPDVIRKYTHIPETKKMVIAISIGYPDWDFPANELKSDREPLENVATWCGFDHSAV